MAAKKKASADADTEAPEGLKLSSAGKVKVDSVVATLARKSLVIEKGFNPRSALGDVDALAKSIGKNGLLSYLTVRPSPTKEGKYSLTGVSQFSLP